MVARLNTDGTLDTSFGPGYGAVSLNYGAPIPELALGVVVQPDGKLVVLGNGGANNDFVLTRLSSTADPDSSFGSSGAATVDFGGSEYDGDLVQQSDGKLVLAGSTDVHDGGDFAVARVLESANGGSPPPPPPPDPTLHIKVTPSTPIATKRTIFTFIVTKFGRGVYKAAVHFDGQVRNTNAGGLVRFAATLAYHPYHVIAVHTGDPTGVATINPRFVPHVFISITPSHPRLGFITTFTFHATLEGRPPLGRTIPARSAVIFFRRPESSRIEPWRRSVPGARRPSLVHGDRHAEERFSAPH